MAFFFVGGSQRSGTTMLQTILCEDPSVNPLIQEAKYLRHLIAAYKFGKNTYKIETKDYFNSTREYYDFNARIVRGFLRHTKSLFKEAKHLVLREPHLTILFPELAELLPKAKFICIVRDPRDVIASMVQVGKKLKAQGANDAMAKLFNSGDMTSLSRHYLSFYKSVLEPAGDSFKERLFLLRYEDLVNDPKNSVNQIRKFTGIPLENFDPDKDPDTGKVDHNKSSQYQRAWKTKQDGKKITDSGIGKYKDTLSTDDIKAIENHCNEFMQRFQYTTNQVT